MSKGSRYGNPVFGSILVSLLMVSRYTCTTFLLALRVRVYVCVKENDESKKRNTRILSRVQL